jgi:hypothetical protein
VFSSKVGFAFAPIIELQGNTLSWKLVVPKGPYKFSPESKTNITYSKTCMT